MKRVYLVADTLLGRDVAFALIESIGPDEADRRRVLQEAQTMARLGEHPNIVTIYELGEEKGQPYMVLPLMAGGTVGELVNREEDQGIPLELAMRIGQDVCRGLEFAHAKGVVHRDLKPSNVWLTSDGVAKIGDFGIAFSMAHTRITHTGRVLGTVQYMSPEQAMGGEIDERSDLYSFGAMLYELIAGRPPFAGSHPVAVISQHINALPLPPSRSGTHFPPAMVALILKLLAKEPSARPQSATEVLSELEAIARATGDERESPAPGRPLELRVLHVEDSVDDSMLVRRELRKGGYDLTVERLDTPAEMKAALEGGTWDIVISDYSMPRFSGPAALKLLDNSGLDLPFIIVSATITEEMAVATMKAGAHDFVMKGNLARLNPAVQRELREAEERRARRKAEHEERRLHGELEKRNRELELLIKGLTAPNAELQERLTGHLEALQRLSEDAGEIVEDARNAWAPGNAGGPEGQ